MPCQIELYEEMSRLSSRMAATDLARKHGLIQRILDDDAEVRRHTEPWMERIFYFLGDGSPRHELQLASTTGSGESTAAG